MNLKLVMSSSERFERPAGTSLTPQRSLLPSGSLGRRLVISIRTDDDWEILVYRRGDVYEACFFRWAIHHEHAIGSSFEAVTQQVEQRIRSLNSRRLKSARWRKVIH